jgi:transposase InsO family protein
MSRDRVNRRGFDHVHSLVDDHPRLAYSEILPDEKGATWSAFLHRAIAYVASHGITRIERLLTDNTWAYRYSLRGVCAEHGISQKVIRPHCPWQTAKWND